MYHTCGYDDEVFTESVSIYFIYCFVINDRYTIGIQIGYEIHNTIWNMNHSYRNMISYVKRYKKAREKIRKRNNKVLRCGPNWVTIVHISPFLPTICVIWLILKCGSNFLRWSLMTVIDNIYWQNSADCTAEKTAVGCMCRNEEKTRGESSLMLLSFFTY